MTIQHKLSLKKLCKSNNIKTLYYYELNKVIYIQLFRTTNNNTDSQTDRRTKTQTDRKTYNLCIIVRTFATTNIKIGQLTRLMISFIYKLSIYV